MLYVRLAKLLATRTLTHLYQSSLTPLQSQAKLQSVFTSCRRQPSFRYIIRY